jgi:hypothetical protein
MRNSTGQPDHFGERACDTMTSPFHHKPLHERFGPWGWMRARLRGMTLSILGRLLATDDGKGILAAVLNGVLRSKPGLDVSDLLESRPYADLGHSSRPLTDAAGRNVIMITARFRTGSTLLWNLFRHVQGCTAYYEPLNERRWFDPSVRGSRVDLTHRGAEEYWREYEGLIDLGHYYREEWISHNLFMDADAWDPNLKSYVDLLIEKSPRRPVLQFNRIDFRLPWFRKNFPGASLVHLYRHPRNQWCSTLMDLHCYNKDAVMADFARHDKFYLLAWANDLKYHFPFLDPRRASHPYQLFYYIWKLSYWFGRRYAHYSLSFEDLVQQPDTTLPALFAWLGIHEYELTKLKQLVVVPPLDKWRDYADEQWFVRQESACEDVLADYLSSTPCRPGEYTSPSLVAGSLQLMKLQ